MGNNKETGLLEWWRGERTLCPRHLHERLENAVDDLHYQEGRFLLIVGAIVALFSLVVDAITLPERFMEIAAVRLGCTLPVQIAAFFAPRSKLGLQKFLLGLSLIFFSLSLLYTSSLMPQPVNIILSIGPLMLLGMAVPLLPFRRRELLLFLFGTGIPLAITALLLLGGGLFTQVYILILLLVAIGSGVLARRVRWLERNSLLLALEAEERAAELESSNNKLRHLSMQDPLTNLANRRWVESAFERDYAFSRDQVPGYTSLFLLDLDHFKEFNDRWGHGAGDDCLLAVSRVLQHAANTHGGIAARFGGEEFVLLLRIEELAQAKVIAEQVRVAVERIEIASGSDNQTATCTTSIGVSIHEGDGPPTLSNLLKSADEALYEAKNDGRNRFKFAA